MCLLYNEKVSQPHTLELLVTQEESRNFEFELK